MVWYEKSVFFFNFSFFSMILFHGSAAFRSFGCFMCVALPQNVSMLFLWYGWLYFFMEVWNTYFGEPILHVGGRYFLLEFVVVTVTPGEGPGISYPTAAVALDNTFNKKKAKIGEKSNPKSGGIIFRNRLR